MVARPSRLIGQLVVLIPTLALSFGLAALHVAVLPRIITAVGFGMILIVCVFIWQRRQGQ